MVQLSRVARALPTPVVDPFACTVPPTVRSPGRSGDPATRQTRPPPLPAVALASASTIEPAASLRLPPASRSTQPPLLPSVDETSTMPAADTLTSASAITITPPPAAAVRPRDVTGPPITTPPAQKLMQPPSPVPSARTAPAVVNVPIALTSRLPPPPPPPLTSMPCENVASPWPSTHTVPPPPPPPVPVAVTGTSTVMGPGAASVMKVRAPPQPPDPPSAATLPPAPAPTATEPAWASSEIVPPNPPASPASVALWPAALMAPLTPVAPLTSPPAHTSMVPPDPASPNPSARSTGPDGGTPSTTFWSAVTSMVPAPNVPPDTLTVFSRSIEPPIARRGMVPPAMLDSVGVSAIRPSPLLPFTVMLPDATTAPFS